jgi:hypothetical protein
MVAASLPVSGQMTKRGAAEQWILNGTSQLQKASGRRYSAPMIEFCRFHGLLPTTTVPLNNYRFSQKYRVRNALRHKTTIIKFLFTSLTCINPGQPSAWAF